MKIAVCIKQVPDTETRPRIAPDGKSLLETDVNWVISPYDEFAVEEALRIKEKKGGEVIVVSLGSDRVQTALRHALAMGADQAVHVKGDGFANADALAIATALAAAIKKIGGVELVLAGKHGVGDDNQAVGGMLAELLDMPQVTVVVKLEVGEGNTAVAHREIEGGTEVVETSLPAVITTQKGLNEPRYASLKGIMAAKKKPLQSWGAADLGLDAEAGKPRAAYLKLELPPARKAGKIVPGEPAEAARELARLLREEAKVI